MHNVTELLFLLCQLLTVPLNFKGVTSLKKKKKNQTFFYFIFLNLKGLMNNVKFKNNLSVVAGKTQFNSKGFKKRVKL